MYSKSGIAQFSCPNLNGPPSSQFNGIDKIEFFFGPPIDN